MPGLNRLDWADRQRYMRDYNDYTVGGQVREKCLLTVSMLHCINKQ